ncbi:MAG: ROK family protein [Candidatus Fermentibacteraceae bacterium]
MSSWWGIDVGGTKVLVGRLAGGAFLEEGTIPTETMDSPEDVVSAVSRLIRHRDPSPLGAGVGVAGLVDGARGLLVSSPNMPAWRDVPVQGMFSKALDTGVTVDNDANAFAFGAVRGGQIPPRGTWLLVTLGTGIGGTVVHDGRILYGTGFAGEFGHMTVMADGERCACGSTGCWELYASKRSLSGYYARAGGDEGIDPRELAARARRGEEAARGAFEEFGAWLGVGMASLGCCLSPHGFVLAGGLAGAFDLFSRRMDAVFAERCHLDLHVRTLPEVRESGALGAALMAREAFGG